MFEIVAPASAVVNLEDNHGGPFLALEPAEDAAYLAWLDANAEELAADSEASAAVESGYWAW